MGAITITGYNSSVGSVVIPSATNGYPVTAIGNNAFQSRSSITNVAIPDGMTSIGSGAYF